MKSLRVLLILILLGIAAPIAIHYRAWSLALPETASPSPAPAQSLGRGSAAVEPQIAAPQTAPATAQMETVHSQPLDASFDLPAASSSLPLLSVIGFGVFLGGLLSALRTRPAHK